MDTKTLLAEAKARFNHNAAKAALQDKYDGKFIVADQGGLWKADQPTITLLSTLIGEYVIILDTFGNPVKVKRYDLLVKLMSTYNSVMTSWHDEWKEAETKR